MSPWHRYAAGHIEVRVRLTPKSSRDAIEGVETAADGTQHLKARVRAVPEDGKANAALMAMVAKMAGVPKSSVTLAAGATSRIKTLAIACEAADCDAILDRLVAG